ncbi:MAG: CPBP family intramembrane glutamic endopeptidase, partial [Pseudomonadota bacterium]
APVFPGPGVTAGRDLAPRAATCPGRAAQPWASQTLLRLAMGGAAAVTEEVAFRGLLLGFLLATLGRRRWGPAAAGLVTALVWAAMHLGMTDAPLLKAGQITLVGLLLAELTRRWGLGAAVATHLGLNLAGAGTALLLTTLSGP